MGLDLIEILTMKLVILANGFADAVTFRKTSALIYIIGGYMHIELDHTEKFYTHNSKIPSTIWFDELLNTVNV